MQQPMDDKQLLAIVNSCIDKNLQKQAFLKEQTEKANTLFNAISYHTNYVQQFKEEFKVTQGNFDQPIYFDQYTRSARDGCTYYKILAKTTELWDYHEKTVLSLGREGLSSAQSDEQSAGAYYDLYNRGNESSDIMTDDQAKYKKRQRYQLTKNTANKMFSPEEDQLLEQMVVQWRLTKINWKVLTQGYNSNVQDSSKHKSTLELYKRHRELTKTNEVIWTEKEDQRLRKMIKKYGTKNNWFQISMNFDTKNSYQCIIQYK